MNTDAYPCGHAPQGYATCRHVECQQAQVAETLARQFHETYERLAPSFGYATRPDTRDFDVTSPNGRLMVAVIQSVIVPLLMVAPRETGLTLSSAGASTSRPEDIARQLVKDWFRDDQRIGIATGQIRSGALERRITAALAAEQERGARIAEHAIGQTRMEIAAAIRAMPRGGA